MKRIADRTQKSTKCQLSRQHISRQTKVREFNFSQKFDYNFIHTEKKNNFRPELKPRALGHRDNRVTSRPNVEQFRSC